jgi:hypothetical protein
MIALAEKKDPAIYVPAMHGLRKICDPDQHDIPRLIDLLFALEEGKQKDEAEKTLLLVCRKLPSDKEIAGPVLRLWESFSEEEKMQILPLLGRLGGQRAMTIIASRLDSEEEKAKKAAIRALCNWPDASVADKLLELVKSTENPTYRRWTLRAYIRVISLPSDRAPEKTLAMLKQAMALAKEPEDKRLAIDRAETARTIETVKWLRPFLDQKSLAQAACRTLVSLAHHRFLRHPNMEIFKPILEKVQEVSEDATIRAEAERYRLGL